MPSDGNNADKTITLKHDFLAVSGQEVLNAEHTLRVPPNPSGGEFSTTGETHELLSRALVNTAAPEQGASIILSSTQERGRDAQIAITKRRKRHDEQRLQLTLLDHARRLSKQLEQQIGKMEDSFEAEMGDAWREQIANKVMAPDDIPERRDGENMEDYRKRLEDVLVATMIDPATGQMKPEYANDPEMFRYGEWAKAKHQKREVDAYVDHRSDPVLSETNKAALDRDFAASATYANLSDTREALASKGKDSLALSATIDNAHQGIETEAANRSEAAAFPPPA